MSIFHNRSRETAPRRLSISPDKSMRNLIRSASGRVACIIALLAGGSAWHAHATVLLDNGLTTATDAYLGAIVDDGGNINSEAFTMTGNDVGHTLRQNVSAQSLIINFLQFGPLSSPTWNDFQGNAAGDSVVTNHITKIGSEAVSGGNITGLNGTIYWSTHTSIEPGTMNLITWVNLQSAQPFGEARFANVRSFSAVGTVFPTGTVAGKDFKIFTLDNTYSCGLAQYGALQTTAGLTNATFEGWGVGAADPSSVDAYSLGGSIVGLTGPTVNPTFGSSYTAIFPTGDFQVWTLDPLATSATITFGLVGMVPKYETVTAPTNGLYNKAGYSFTPKVVGGFPPLSYSVTVGSLPPGITIDSASGTLSGTPTQLGTFNYSVTVAGLGSGSHTDVKAYSITVDKAPSVVQWPTASAIFLPQTLTDTVLSGATNSVPGTFVLDTSYVIPGVGTYNVPITFTPTDAAHYTTLNSTVSVQVKNKTIPTGTWPSASAITIGQTLAAVTLSGGSLNTPGSFALDTTYPIGGIGTYQVPVVFTPTDAIQYAKVTNNVSVLVTDKIIPSIAWPTASSITVLQALTDVTISGGWSSTPGNFVLNTAFPIAGAGSYNVPVTFTPNDTVHYTTATGTTPVQVNKLDQTIAFGVIADQPNMTPITLSATASSALAVTFTVVSGPAVISGGNQLSFTGPGTVTVAASQAGNATWSAAVQVTRTFTAGFTAPVIQSQPQSVAAVVGGKAQFSVVVTGGNPMHYQWRFNGTPIPGATSSSWVFNYLTKTNSGNVDVVISNSYGTTTSQIAHLEVSTYTVWGDNRDGQSTPFDDQISPIALALGWKHTLALYSDGSIKARGANDWGQTNVPAGLANVVAVSAGAFHSLALKANGTVAAWGVYGQSLVPPSLSNVVAISSGGFHNMALKADGTVVCWGYNFYGECTPPAGLTQVKAIAAGSYHSLALKADGTVVAWGNNIAGQSTVPAGLQHVKGIAAGAYHSIVCLENGTVTGWGDNRYYQLAAPDGLTGVVKVVCGDSHSLALKQDGTVVSWGHNQWLQSEVPTNLVGVKDIAAGGDHSMVILATP